MIWTFGEQDMPIFSDFLVFSPFISVLHNDIDVSFDDYGKMYGGNVCSSTSRIQVWELCHAIDKLWVSRNFNSSAFRSLSVSAFEIPSP